MHETVEAARGSVMQEMRDREAYTRNAMYYLETLDSQIRDLLPGEVDRFIRSALLSSLEGASKALARAVDA